MGKVIIYSDGACKNNPGPGGWGAVLLYAGKIKELSGGAQSTTNNQMEIQAAIEALRSLKKTCEIDFYTDSKYLQNGITDWIANWKRNGWRTSNKRPVKNKDLWQELDRLVQLQQISWLWTQGHAGDWGNERAHRLASVAMRKLLE